MLSYVFQQRDRTVSDLCGTRSMGAIMKLKHNNNLEVFVDVSFFGDSNPKEVAFNRGTMRSRCRHGLRTYA